MIRPKMVTEYGVPYSKIYDHQFGEFYNKIAVTTDGVVLWTNPKNGSVVEITRSFIGKNVEISYAGNVIVVYCASEKKQEVYKFEKDTYKSYDVAIKPITEAIVVCGYDSSNPAKNTAIADSSASESLNDALSKAASGFYSKYPNGLCGAAVIGCSYELNDGNEVWSTAFIVANATRENGYVKPSIDDQLNVTVTGASSVKINLTFAKIDATNIRKINIYASRPVFPYQVEYTSGNNHIIVETALSEAGLDSQIMYYQGSVSPEKDYASFKLNFGADQAGDALMEVNSGCIERVGNSISYNNRFHYFKSETVHLMQMPTVSRTASARDNDPYWVAFVEINNKWERVDYSYKFSSTLPNDFIYPMAGVKKLAFVKIGNGENTIMTRYDDMFYVDLMDSSSYNYSFAFDVTPEIVSSAELYDIVKEYNQHLYGNHNKKVLWKKESNAINVSAPYNPYVFQVEYSYGFSGEIVDIATSYLPISSTQVGQYPLNVFTSNGIFALSQGDGNVLYSNIVPVQPLIASGKPISTPFGTFFFSSKSLFMLSGRETMNISVVLTGERELRLRENSAYKKLCYDKAGTFYNFSNLLSQEEFEVFIENAVLAYDQLHNELYISSTLPEIPYSYVLNIDTKTFYKASRKFIQSQSSSRYAIEMEGSNRNIVDMHTELPSEQNILLQSRPMSLEMAYTHIQRMLLLVDAKFDGDQNLCLTVFASDNLYDWNCIISSQKKNVALRQIRTNKAAKSYKDYIVLITGTVDTNTDLSSLIADYTVVNRRLG